MSLESDAQAFVDRVARKLAEQPSYGITELMEEVETYLCTEAVSIFMLDRSSSDLVLKYAVEPVGQSIIGLRIPVGQGVVGWVVQHIEDLIVPSTDLDPRFYGSVDEQTGFVTRSILCVPMVQSGQVIGAIEVMNKQTGHFNVDDVLVMKAIANIVTDYV